MRDTTAQPRVLRAVGRREFLRWSGLATLGSVIAACGGSSPTGPSGSATPGAAGSPTPAFDSTRLLQAAKAEGQVNWYTIITVAQAQKLAKQFEDAFGIKVELTVQTSAALMQKYQLEWDSKYSYADVVTGSDVDVFASMADKGMLKEFDSPNGKKIIEPLRDQKGRWYTFYVLVYLMAYNKNVLPEKDAPKSWRELTDPKYKGQLVVAGQNASGATFIMQSQWYKMFGAAWFRAFAANNPVNVATHSAMVTLVESGQKAIMSENALHLILPGAAKGVVPVWPTEGPLLIPVPMSIATNAPHPNAAALLADWLLSKEIQTQFVKDYPSASGNPDVPRLYGIPSLATANTPDVTYLRANHDEIWNAWSAALGIK
jgi:iron(III) transport system substrate-binding protein